VSDIPLRYPISALVSFHYFERHDIAQMQGWGLRLIGDSGAFSAQTQGTPIDLKRFAEWGARWKDSLFWIASLDVIGDAKASRKNYERLRSMGLDVIPTIHYGAAPELISGYAKDGVDFIGLGGMVGKKSEAQRLLRWTLSIFRYAKEHHPGTRFHGWGVTHPDLVMNLPWFSVDSSGFSSSYRFARLSLFDPRSGKRVGVGLNGKDIFKHSDLLRSIYDADPEKVAVSNSETRRDLVRLSVSSVQKLEEYLQKRHAVPAPIYGLSGNPDGPCVHAAVGFPGSQATLGLSPTDKAPRLIDGPSIHVANPGITDYEFMRDEKRRRQ